jgi:hypothetical protein
VRVSKQECDGVILFGPNPEIESPTRKSLHIETPIEFFTASPPMGPLLIKPAEVMLLYAGADKQEKVSFLFLPPQGNACVRGWPSFCHLRAETLAVASICPAHESPGNSPLPSPPHPRIQRADHARRDHTRTGQAGAVGTQPTSSFQPKIAWRQYVYTRENCQKLRTS